MANFSIDTKDESNDREAVFISIEKEISLEDVSEG